MLKRYWKSIAVTIAILYLSFANMPDVPPKLKLISWDKLAHIIMYFALGYILMTEYFSGKMLIYKSLPFIIICMLYPVTLGGLTEIIQGTFFPPRETDLFDWLSDVTGVISSWYIYSLIRKRKEE